ncbi:MAG TPA: DUF4386 domain-containing protein, partial [Actinomycetota bacterium]|nr:DUF4386 domain-containing protein [Actinomycetota bacterium]
MTRREESTVTSSQTIARVAGVLFLITFATAIGALYLFQPVLDDPAGYIAGAGADNRIYFGALLELLLIVANIGTAVVLFPILRRQNEILALGYVTARIVECAFILAGILAVLSLVTLGQEDSGAEAGLIGYTLAEIKDWTSILGPGWVVGLGNGLILGYLMYRSGLVPRPLAALGLIGGPLIVLSGTLVLFDVIDQGGTGQGLATIPEFFWELGLGLYLTVEGFKPSPILAGMPGPSCRRPDRGPGELESSWRRRECVESLPHPPQSLATSLERARGAIRHNRMSSWPIIKEKATKDFRRRKSRSLSLFQPTLVARVFCKEISLTFGHRPQI